MSIKGMKFDAEGELALMRSILMPDMKLDPLKFVMYCYPWGKRGSPLERHRGPRKWQRKELEAIRDHMYENQYKINRGERPEPYNLSVASGRGIGKSAMVAWLEHWVMSTQIGATVLLTANTEQQLKSRTWAEVGKWHTMAINSHWFTRTATTLRPAPWFDAALKDKGIDTEYYYAQCQLWSEENPDAFAGIHNEAGVMLIMDEASGIPEPIWSVSEGFFTEPVLCRFWCCFSNPRRPQGAFYDCFHKNAAYWRTRHIDSRDVEGTDVEIYNKLIEQYGEDSDEARVEVKGQFPRTGSNQLIGAALVEEASRRHLRLPDVEMSARVIGVDVARFGDDSSVIQKRQGLYVHPPTEFKGLDNMALAGVVAAQAAEWEAEAIFVDAGGGQGVIDRLRQLGFDVFEVNFGSSADNREIYMNKRIEMWSRMKEFLEQGGVIPDHQRLKEDLVAPTYKYTTGTNKKQLESKEEMKKRGLPSTDFGDALCLTFAFEVAPSARLGNNGQGNVITDYDPYATLG